MNMLKGYKFIKKLQPRLTPCAELGASHSTNRFQRQNQGNLRLDHQEQKRTQTFKEHMLGYMTDPKKILNNH